MRLTTATVLAVLLVACKKDADKDGYPAGADCNDNNAAINPGAVETCDGIDNNCDGNTDEDLAATFFADIDGDGYGDANNKIEACDQPDGYTENSDDYGLGNETRATAWVARQFRPDLSGSLRIAWEHLGDYTGADPRLDPNVGPSMDPAAQGGDRLHIFLGVNYTHPGGHRFAGEMGGPIFQDLNGPQLETDIIYRIGWQFSF